MFVNRYLHSQGLDGVQAALPLTVVVACVVGAGLLAIGAGCMPAWRAARLAAREAVEA